MANALEQSENYRVLRRLIPRTLSKPPAEESKIGILLDFETTLCDIDADCRDFPLKFFETIDLLLHHRFVFV
jgi:hypothetical protein